MDEKEDSNDGRKECEELHGRSKMEYLQLNKRVHR
jgi:hypothetical protein